MKEKVVHDAPRWPSRSPPVSTPRCCPRLAVGTRRPLRDKPSPSVFHSRRRGGGEFLARWPTFLRRLVLWCLPLCRPPCLSARLSDLSGLSLSFSVCVSVSFCACLSSLCRGCQSAFLSVCVCLFYLLCSVEAQTVYFVILRHILQTNYEKIGSKMFVLV